MSKQKQQSTEQTSKAPIKATAAITFIMGLLTVLAIAPEYVLTHRIHHHRRVCAGPLCGTSR